jgi:hypothetical protein
LYLGSCSHDTDIEELKGVQSCFANIPANFGLSEPAIVIVNPESELPVARSYGANPDFLVVYKHYRLIGSVEIPQSVESIALTLPGCTGEEVEGWCDLEERVTNVSVDPVPDALFDLGPVTTELEPGDDASECR